MTDESPMTIMRFHAWTGEAARVYGGISNKGCSFESRNDWWRASDGGNSPTHRGCKPDSLIESGRERDPAARCLIRMGDTVKQPLKSLGHLKVPRLRNPLGANDHGPPFGKRDKQTVVTAIGLLLTAILSSLGTFAMSEAKSYIPQIQPAKRRKWGRLVNKPRTSSHCDQA